MFSSRFARLPLIVGLVCSAAFCGIAVSLFSSDYAEAGQLTPVGEQCGNGEIILDVDSGTCLERLLPEYGYQASEWREPPPTAIECSESALRRGVEAGGHVKIPSGCSISLTGELRPANNTVISGSGHESSTLRCQSDLTHAFRMNDRVNVVVRDLKVDGGAKCKQLFGINNANNVLVERVDVFNGRIKAFGHNGSRNVTIRYSKIHDLAGRDAHGVGIDDNYVSVALYSNEIYRVNGYGINSHAQRAEIAGNYLHDNNWGMKFPDAVDTLVHHNTLRDSSDYQGIRIYEDEERRPTRVVFAANNIATSALKSRSEPFDLREGDDVYLAHNELTSKADSGHDRSKVVDVAKLTVCSGSASASTVASEVVSSADVYFSGARSLDVCRISRQLPQHQDSSPSDSDPAASNPQTSEDAVSEAIVQDAIVVTPRSVAQSLEPVSIFNTPADPSCSSSTIEVSHCQVGNDAKNLTDDDPGTRWSADGIAVARLDFGRIRNVDSIGIGWYLGDQRTADFQVATSTDGRIWTPIGSRAETSGRSVDPEWEDVGRSARFVAVAGFGNSSTDSSEWNSLTELKVRFQDSLLPPEEPPEDVVKPIAEQPESDDRFISAEGDGSSGRSWESAWTDFDEIVWSDVSSGATIWVDGGNCGESTTYNSPLVISVDDVRVKRSNQPGRCGQINHNGQPGDTSKPLVQCGTTGWESPLTQGAVGISIQANDVTIDGGDWAGWRIHGWSTAGLDIHPTVKRFELSHTEIHNNGRMDAAGNGYDGISVAANAVMPNQPGIRLAGDDIVLARNLIHDNGQDAIQSRWNAESPTNVTISESWLANLRRWERSSATAWPNGGPKHGLEESWNFCSHTDGLQVYSGGEWSAIKIEDSFFGPGLTNGLILGDSEASVHELTMLNTTVYKSADNDVMNHPYASGSRWNLDRLSVVSPELRAGKKQLWLRGYEHTVSRSVFVGGGYGGGSRSEITSEGDTSIDGGGNCIVGNNVAGASLAVGFDPQVRVSSDMWSLDNVAASGSSCMGSSIGHPNDVLAASGYRYQGVDETTGQMLLAND